MSTNSAVDLERALEQRTRELEQSLLQQAATAEVLKAISRSSFDLQTVLDRLVKTAARLCEAEMSGVTRPIDGCHRHVANYGCPPDFFTHLKTIRLPPGRGSVVGRVLQAGQTIQIDDVLADPEYAQREAQRLGGFRSLLGVPLLRDGNAIGVLVLYRREVRPFTPRQIELLTTFADQAVIAIENARLIDEIGSRTRQLASALEEQTATARILRAISSKPSDATPVFEAIARSAVDLCGALFANVFLYDGEVLHYVASHATASGFAELLREKFPMRPDTSQVSGRVILENRVVRIEDVRADPDFDPCFPPLMNWRRKLGVPMKLKGRTLGTIVIAWADPGPIPPTQEDLLKTFADQAALAVEHTRLFREIEERNSDLTRALAERTAVAEVLRVISSSPTDVAPVFECIARHAVALSGSLFANVFRFDGELLHYVTSHEVSSAFVDLLHTKFPMRPDRSQVAGRVVLTGSVIRLDDACADPEYDQRFPKALSWRRMLGVPLLQDGETVGAIVVAWADPGPIPMAQEELLKTFADQAIIAIEHVRLFRELEGRNQQLAVANSFKSRFLSSASHDLRQPLHALNLFVAQLSAETESLDRERLVHRISDAVGAMNELFDALLDMSKLEAGVLEPTLAVFPIARMLERLETTFSGTAREKGLRLRVVASSACVCSDVILLERMLFNLVSNAVRYTEQGSVLIGCRRRGRNLRLDVIDTGIGIPESEHAEIFSEFYQLDHGRTARQGGLGLGLSIVDRLGRLLGHAVELRTEVGSGSRFSVLVPRAGGETAVAINPMAVPIAADRVGKKLVVVIDDDPMVLDGMRGILQSWGCRVVAASSALEALDLLSRDTRVPDLIISDLRLADACTGIEAIDALCERCGKEIPAFLISGDTGPKRLREAQASGYRLLHKPVPPMALRAILNRLLGAYT